jgi:hypothetical protein
MNAIAEADEKKRMISKSSASGDSSSTPPKYRMVYIPPWGSCAGLNSSRIGAIAVVPTATALAATTAATVQPCSYSTSATGCYQATIAVSCQ